MFGKTILESKHLEAIAAKDAEILKLTEELTAAKASVITEEQLEAARAEVPEAAQAQITTLNDRITELEGAAAGGGATRQVKTGADDPNGGTSNGVDWEAIDSLPHNKNADKY